MNATASTLNWLLRNLTAHQATTHREPHGPVIIGVTGRTVSRLTRLSQQTRHKVTNPFTGEEEHRDPLPKRIDVPVLRGMSNAIYRARRRQAARAAAGRYAW